MAAALLCRHMLWQNPRVLIFLLKLRITILLQNQGQKKENNVQHTETISIKPLIKASQDATSSNFIALYGQEFSTISSGNHINVFGINEVLTVDNGDFKGLLAKLKTLPKQPVLQMNHPDVHMDLFYNGTKSSIKENMFNDYGIDANDLGPHFKDLVKAM